ncbi:hypothetical protein EVAR_59142_1 [Eumeta japonica]|uniref:Uncharacterized protein n=1 Tax=Eumeta variegata TaxID=151549 RepID=A0A4C1ZCN4_EUMVA|nr:hypothetical protein EVAR_59142_1 [Eumeta japonica]
MAGRRVYCITKSDGSLVVLLKYCLSYGNAGMNDIRERGKYGLAFGDRSASDRCRIRAGDVPDRLMKNRSSSGGVSTLTCKCAGDCSVVVKSFD